MEGRGFRVDAPVSLYYRGELLGQVQADAHGAFATTLPLPAGVGPEFYLVAVDAAGTSASTSGRHIWGDVAVGTAAPAEAGAQEESTDQRHGSLALPEGESRE